MARAWPYPLKIGTNVIAKVHNLLQRVDVQVVGVVVEVIRGELQPASAGCTYVVRTTDGVLVQTLSPRTTPVDTKSVQGLDIWMDALERATKQPETLTGLPAPVELSTATGIRLTGVGGITTGGTNTTITMPPNSVMVGQTIRFPPGSLTAGRGIVITDNGDGTAHISLDPNTP